MTVPKNNVDNEDKRDIIIINYTFYGCKLYIIDFFKTDLL